MKNTVTNIFAVIVILTIIGISGARSEKKLYIGTAIDLKTGSLIYFEEHEASYKDDHHVATKIIYRDTNDAVIAEKNIEFVPGSAVAQFRLEDFRFGTIEGSETVSSSVKLYSRGDSRSEMKEKTLAIPAPVAVDGGLNTMVRNNWEKLITGKPVDFFLGVPSQLDYYHFRVVKDREEIFNGKKTLVVRFESDFWFIRLFVDPVMVWYDKETRRALQYEGISNLYNKDGKSYIVRVTFDKPGP